MALRTALLLASFVAALQYAYGIIPTPCVVDNSTIMADCCPIPSLSGVPNAGPCGSMLNRGECVPVSNINARCVRNDSETDARKNWPHFFEKLCQCNGNYYGYDCGECKYGYRGENCSEPYMRKRKSVSALTPAERDAYIEALMNAKHNQSYDRYMAIRSEDPLDLVPVTLYDLFTWLHYYAGRENDELGTPNTTALDFAHESGGFPTWHRQYLLWLERELQIQTGDDEFSVPYWEWTVEDDRDFLFNDDWLGGIDESEQGAITGYFGSIDTWPIICDTANATHFCDPTMRTGQLRRCPSTSECEKTDERWPTQEALMTAINMDTYDSDPYSRYSSSGFRNYMEGFDNNGCSDTEDVLCSGGIRRRLHNTVHIILGIGDFSNIPNLMHTGTMGNVPVAANDPIFINHHAMIDYILEQWLLQDYGAPYQPSDDEDSKFQGHRGSDCLVPFIPLGTNLDFYKVSTEFGYEYEPVSRDRGGDDDGSGIRVAGATGVVAAAALLTVTLAI